METKVQQKNQNKTKVLAGIFEGIEGFWHEDEKWVLHDRRAMRYEDAPGRVQRALAVAFLNDHKSRNYLKRIGCNSFSKGMEMWYKCVIGGLDYTPDILDGNYTPDAFNNSCKDFNCPHRGKFCSLAPGLQNFEVRTIQALKEGLTIEQAAAKLYVSVPGIKSRIDRIKEKLEAKNMAELIAKATEMGI